MLMEINMKAIFSAIDLGKKLDVLNNIQVKYHNVHFLLHKENIRLDMHIIKNIDEAFQLPINSIIYMCKTDINSSDYIELFYDMLDKYINTFNILKTENYILVIQGIFKTSEGYEFKCSHFKLPKQQTLCFIKEI